MAHGKIASLQRTANNATIYDCRDAAECERYAKTISHATGRIFTRCLCDCELSERWREGCEACYFIEVPAENK